MFQKEWDSNGIEMNGKTQRQGLFSTWDYFPNGDLKYKVTYKGFQKKMKHGIEWYFYSDRSWKKINLYSHGELKLSRKWRKGESISRDTFYHSGKIEFEITPNTDKRNVNLLSKN